MKRTRPKTPAPTNGWLLSELAKLSGLPESTLRYYGGQKLIHPIQLRGTVTRYSRQDLMLVLGLARLKSDDTSTLAEKKHKLEALGERELERWLRTGPLSTEAAQALGFEVTAITQSGIPSIDEGNLEVRHAGIEVWQRIPLLPGLDLMLRADAKVVARLAAKRICEEYVTGFAG